MSASASTVWSSSDRRVRRRRQSVAASPSVQLVARVVRAVVVSSYAVATRVVHDVGLHGEPPAGGAPPIDPAGISRVGRSWPAGQRSTDGTSAIDPVALCVPARASRTSRAAVRRRHRSTPVIEDTDLAPRRIDGGPGDLVPPPGRWVRPGERELAPSAASCCFSAPAPPSRPTVHCDLAPGWLLLPNR